ncbi:MAG: NAD(P)-dependent glycerol-3-phosphate dehydrogenase [Planctomycetaceae bacterium]|nr:NAD(P)-dependent glycerol-3-phosphate dehydrogenase [Planctomycetaceae bacterium]
MSEHKKRIAVIGDGAWGTAIALVLHGSGHWIRMWSHDAEYLETMRTTGRNSRFLPTATLPADIDYDPVLAHCLQWADLVVVAVPSKFLRSVLSGGAGALPEETPVLSLTKGFDCETLRRPSEVVRECLGARHVVALSGPSHAEEVARGLPASVVVAAEELETARRIQRIVTTSRFRVYASRDIVGVEVAGAVKNIIALAAGIANGMELGDNTLAALATRGLVEMTRLGVALGGEPSTFSGLAGMGDLITTCVSDFSRNRAVGRRLAKGETLETILASMSGVPESVSTTSLAVSLAKHHHVSMPITEQVAAVLWDGKAPQQALDELMSRARKDED